MSLALVVVLLVAHQVDSIWGSMLKLVVVLVLISLMAKQISYIVGSLPERLRRSRVSPFWCM